MPLPQPLIVYTVHERERDGRKFWTRVGDATVARDGQINIVLRALPVNGTLALRGLKTTEIASTAHAEAIANVLALAERVVDAQEAALDASGVGVQKDVERAIEDRDGVLQELADAMHMLRVARST
jgi:hypothetical protein